MQVTVAAKRLGWEKPRPPKRNPQTKMEINTSLLDWSWQRLGGSKQVETKMEGRVERLGNLVP